MVFISSQLLSESSFSVLVCTSAIVTAFVSPLLTLSFRSHRHPSSFQRRSVQSGRPDSELRLLFCLHSARHIPPVLALLDASNPTKRQPVSALALHLVELSSRPSSILITTAAATNNHSSSATASIARALKSYEDRASGASIRTLAAVSPYPTMHQDVASVSEDFRAALVVLPFHKHRTVDGGMEAANPSLRSLNQSVLASAPCSVAILIDRGVSRLGAHRSAAVFFLGGPDDREALAFASRVAGRREFSLTVLRLVGPGRSDESALDDECVAEFRLRCAGDDAVVYGESEAGTAEDTVAALRTLVDGRHDLCIVGKGGGAGSPLVAGLSEWSECMELGPIGDLLGSPDFGATVTSVLVVQQFLPMEVGGEEAAARGKMMRSSSRGRFEMVAAEKASYRTRSLAGL